MLDLWDALGGISWIHDTEGIRNHVLFWASHVVAFGKHFKNQLLKSISENIFQKYFKFC